MKKTLTLSLLIILISFTTFVKASHYMGGEITWECLSNGNYRFHLYFYRECAGILFPNSIILNSNSPAGNISMNLYPNDTLGRTDISPVCNPNPLFTHISCATASTSNLGAVEEWFYTSDFAYPNGITLNGVPPVSGWIFSYASCCRNPSTNIVGQQAIYLRAVIYPYNNQNANPCFDNSPRFTEKPISLICNGYPFSYNDNANDPDLDSLAYEWSPAMQSANTPITSYTLGYSYSSPMSSTTANPNNIPSIIDPSTGEISLLSYTNGAFVTNVKVTSFKCGVKVSEVFREMSVVILSCGANNPPAVTPPFQNPVTGLYTDYIDTVFAGDSVYFNMSATDFGFLPNSTPQTITIEATGLQFGTGYTSTASGCLNPPCATLTPAPPIIGQFGVQTTFNWQTDCAHLSSNTGCGSTANIYNFIVKALDDFCPAPAQTISTITIVVLPKDTAEFISVPDSLQQYVMNFFDMSTGNPNSWYWDFGDGFSSTLQNPSHTYANIGTYNVCLLPYDTSGYHCYSSVCHQVTIAPNMQAGFSFTQDSIYSNKYHFSDNSIGTVNSWSWDFDDNTSSNVQNPTHSFVNPGLYDVELTVADTNYPGFFDIYSQQIDIPHCQANYTYTQDNFQPLIYHFIDSSITNINTWYWDFDDGLTSAAQNPVHNYAIAGVYNVCLVASDSNLVNCADTICKQIAVIAGPVYDISGQVFAGTNPIDYGSAYLYSHSIGTIIPVDTFDIDTVGAFFFHQIAAGYYIIKAELDTVSTYYNQYFPTYYGDVLTWTTASSLNLNQNLNNIDIGMIVVPGPIPGPASILGSVSSSGNKGGAFGIPVSDIEVLLFDELKNHLSLSYTNSSGSFNFNNIAYGTYIVHPEIAGKTTIPSTITIDEDNPSATLLFVVDSNYITLSVEDTEISNDFKISKAYPNPFNDEVYIDISSNKAAKLIITILDPIGKELSTQEIESTTGVKKHRLNIDNLPQNFYYMQITLPNNKIVVRKLVKIQ